MFERYTEKARQCIFFARYEAGHAGAAFIEPEHLLLGMVRADRGVFARLSPNIDWEVGRSKLARSVGVSSDTSRDMPLSHPSQRVLEYAGQEHERLHHPCIECRHLLLGLVSSGNSATIQFLLDQSIDHERILADFQTLPPEPRAGAPSTFGVPVSLRKRLEELRAKFGPAIGQMGSNGFGISNSTATDNGYTGRASASYTDEGWRVIETHQFYDGHEITTLERLRLSEDGRTLSYSIDITGPDGETHRHAMDFPLGEPPQPK